MTKFSIIMPAYNCERTIRKSIGSIINQSYDEYELIIIDDGSTDSTASIIKSELDNSKIIYKKIENKGPGNARNKGIELANGDYIIFLDSDDYVEKNMLKIIDRYTNKYNPELIIYGYYNEEDSGNVYLARDNSMREMNSEEFWNRYCEIDNNFMTYPVWNKVYKRKLICDYNARFPIDVNVAEDMYFNLDIYVKAEKILIVEDKLYHYVFHKGNSISQKFNKNRINEFLKVYNKQLTILEIKCPKAINNCYNMLLYEISAYINNMYKSGVDLKWKDKKKLLKNIVIKPEVATALLSVQCSNIRNKIVKIFLKGRMYDLLLLTGWVSKVKRSFFNQ